jgi:hypothetical protein
MRPRLLASGLLAAAVLWGAGCGRSPTDQAGQILEKYRKASASKPLPASGMIRIRLSAPEGRPAATGRADILWEPGRYRESVTSAGLTTVRGIESGKAYFTDGDGVTRVASEPVLRELLTRSYFWRRAWLFQDRETARLRLARGDEASVSVSLLPEGGNPLRLIFSRADGRLLSARSPRFRLDFSSAVSFRDLSNPETPVVGQISWSGLPTGRIPQPYVGGGRARFGETPAEARFERRAGGILVPAWLSGRAIRLAVDADAAGPVAVAPALADRLGLRFEPDVYGREIAGGASLEIGTVSYPSLFVQKGGAMPPGADAVAGGCLFREAIVELDSRAGRLRLHAPARFVPPEGYFRIVIDDDDDRPVAILDLGSRDMRLTAGSDTGEAALVLAGKTADRLGLAGETNLTGATWGPIDLPPLPLRIGRGAFFPDWGDDGKLGFAALLPFHVFWNMPQRWIYVRPLEP